MKHVSLNVNQNVLIVPVLDLQDVTDQTVGAQGVGKVVNGLLVFFRTSLPVLLLEVVNDGCVWPACLLLDRGDR